VVPGTPADSAWQWPGDAGRCVIELAADQLGAYRHRLLAAILAARGLRCFGLRHLPLAGIRTHANDRQTRDPQPGTPQWNESNNLRWLICLDGTGPKLLHRLVLETPSRNPSRLGFKLNRCGIDRPRLIAYWPRLGNPLRRRRIVAVQYQPVVPRTPG
jgi:hypothetical protein